MDTKEAFLPQRLFHGCGLGLRIAEDFCSALFAAIDHEAAESSHKRISHLFIQVDLLLRRDTDIAGRIEHRGIIVEADMPAARVHRALIQQVEASDPLQVPSSLRHLIQVFLQQQPFIRSDVGDLQFPFHLLSQLSLYRRSFAAACGIHPAAAGCLPR